VGATSAINYITQGVLEVEKFLREIPKRLDYPTLYPVKE
jgi:hypothetical protein